jgi:hypothetical protein
MLGRRTGILALLGGASPETDRRDVNLRWLAACVLAGMTGAGASALHHGCREHSCRPRRPARVPTSG